MLKLFLISSLFVLNSCIGSAVVNEIQSVNYNGKLLKKGNAQGCFGLLILKNEIKVDTMSVCYCVSKKENLWGFVLPGDSISKEKGSLNVKVYRKGTITTFNYPFCLE